MMFFKNAIILVAAYFLGNISPSIIIGKLNGIDIKKEGSGNAGTTNAMRVLGVKAGILTLLIDILKAVVAVKLGMHFGGQLTGEICMLAVMLGHVYPALYRFKGGKGVASAFGAILAVNWQSALCVLAVALIGAALSKKMSVGSLSAAVSYPIFVFLIYSKEDLKRFLPIAIMMALLIIYTHRANIGRLIRGEENNISFGKKKNK